MAIGAKESSKEESFTFKLREARMMGNGQITRVREKAGSLQLMEEISTSETGITAKGREEVFILK